MEMMEALANLCIYASIWLRRKKIHTGLTAKNKVLTHEPNKQDVTSIFS